MGKRRRELKKRKAKALLPEAWAQFGIEQKRGQLWYETRTGEPFSDIRFRRRLTKAQEKLKEKQARSLIKAFRKEAADLKKQIPSVLKSSTAKRIAEEKLAKITSCSTIAQRFDRVGRVSGELGKHDMLVKLEAVKGDNPLKEEPSTAAPKERLKELLEQAEYMTNWRIDRYGYNCRVLFDEGAFFMPPVRTVRNGGYIQETKHDGVLAVQLFDPGPKALLQLAKTMAKRRPDKPLVIIDLYGRVFYP